MGVSLRRILLLSLSLLMAAAASGQKKDRSDSLVTLISAKSAQLLEENGYHYRKVIGPARFFHNNTYLLCDTALWNTDTRIIKAYGHVKLIQEQTTLSSETADYVIDEDMAKFRGSTVQLEDKDKNVLRTRYLDYNTKDSVAIFQNGGSMRDKDGQIIESRYGSYEAKEKKFTFMDNVNMYTDSVFVKTSRLMYKSDENTAYFGYGTDAWKDESMLSADDGYYKRDIELFFFRKRVHIMNDKQEGWSDSLYYDRGLFTVEMLGHAEVMDTTRNAYGLAGRIEYIDSISRVKMTRDPAVMSVSETESKRDTLYIGADTLIFLSKRMCDIAEDEIKSAETRLNDMAGDPVAEYRRKAAEAAAKAAEEAAQNDPNRPPDIPGKNGAQQKPEDTPQEDEEEPAGTNVPAEPPVSEVEKPLPDSLAAPPDSLLVPRDSLTALSDTLTAPVDSTAVVPSDSTAVIPSEVEKSLPDTLAAPADSLMAAADSVVAPKDTTKIDIAYAISRVKMYKEDTQFVCDSLIYTALDSLYRLYIDPIVYNEGNKQYVADSIFVATKNGAINKASLMSNAFVTTEEEPNLYDQIRGAEVMAYFDSTGVLSRFDGLGGAAAIFYLEENGSFATVNKVESKMLCALFEDGQVERIFYFDEAKNDAYPVVQLPKEERQLKGFRWEPEKRPTGREDVTPLVPRPSERTEYSSHERPDFKETAVYFPGHMAAIYKEMEKRDSLEAAAARRRAEKAKEEPESPVDSLSFDTLRDSLTAIGDSLSVSADSLGIPRDSASVISSEGEKSPSDSTETGKIHVPTKEELKAMQKAERERKRAEREAALEAKWAEKDRIDAEKAAAKAEKAKARKRKRNLKFLQKQQKQEEKDAKLLERFKERLQKKQSKKKK